MKRAVLVCTLVLASILTGCAGPQAGEGLVAAPLEIQERISAEDGVTVCRLSNGLTVIVAASHNAPVVCVRAYVRAGGLYEGKYLGCGISHLCEHLVAKGAVHDHEGGAAAKTKQTSSRVDRIGGQSNAYTSMAHTCYYIAATAGKADECIDLVADWMARPEITEEDFRREHGVVTRELEMGRDSPDRQMWYAHARNFYGTHPAAVPVIGLVEPLAALTRDDVRDYHGRMYVPQNMVLVVAGDVSAESAVDRVRRAFAGFAPGRSPDLSLPPVAPVADVRRVTLTSASATETMENLSFRTIPLVHEDLYALDVLSDVLSAGESSLLVRKIKREGKLVTSIDTSSWTPAWGDGQFVVRFRCEPASADAAEKAILAELAKVVAEGVDGQELERAKRQKVAEYVYSQQTVESRSATLGSDYLATGDVAFSRSYADRIQDVTAEQVRAVAGKYFDFSRMVITRMVPAGADQAAAAGPAGESETGRTRTFTLPNGLRVVLHVTPAVDLVSATLATRGGLLVETPQTNGMGTLMTALSTRGAGERSAEQIAEFFARAGGGVAGRCGNNTFYWQATVLADSFEKALPVFADVVCRPTFPQGELDILRRPLLAQIRRTEEDWYGQLNSRFRKDFFAGSPLAMQTIGSEGVVAAADRQAVVDYYRSHVNGGSSVLTIYGKFDLDRAAEQVEKHFSSMPAGDNKTPEVSPRQVSAQGETRVHPTDLKGCAVMVAAPGMTIADIDDRLAMDVLDTIISGYRLPRGWLHSELRGQELVYVVHAFNWTALVPGAFATYAQCEPTNGPRVAEIILKNYRRTLTYDFSQAEVDEAVNIILTAEVLENQSMGSLSMQAALDELYGFGYDFRKTYEKRLRSITPADVSAVANKYLSGGYVTTIVTPQGDKAEAPGSNER